MNTVESRCSIELNIPEESNRNTEMGRQHGGIHQGARERTAVARDVLQEERGTDDFNTPAPPASPVQQPGDLSEPGEERKGVILLEGQQDVETLPCPQDNHPHASAWPNSSLIPFPHPLTCHQLPSHPVNPWDCQGRSPRAPAAFH